MATTPSPKAAHYEAALDAALLKGNWTDSHAGKAPNGTDLSWGELIRKWGKHTGGNVVLIQQLRNISILYSAPTSHPSSSSTYFTAQPAGYNVDPKESSDDAGPSTHSDGSHKHQNGVTSGFHVPHPHLRRPKSKPSLDGGQDLSITTSHTFAQPSGSRGDDDGPDESAWSEGPGWWTGVRRDREGELEQGLKEVEALVTGGLLRPRERATAETVVAQQLSALGRHSQVLQRLDGLPVEAGGILDRIRSACLRGIALELSTPGNTVDAISAYTSIFNTLSDPWSPPSPAYLTAPSSATKIPFESHHELFRWISTALSRASIISARLPNSTTQTLRILRTFHAYSASWPPNFRPIQRQRMILLYLRALYAAYPPASSPCPTPYLLGDSPSPTLDARSVWRAETAEAIKLGRQLLSSTTTFPRAGSVNHPVIAFVDLVAALADKCPLLDRDAINIMWWAMSYTFQSLSVLRHLTRLLAAVGDSDDARRIFELYVKLVLKDRETHQPEVSLQLKRRPTEDSAASPIEIHQEATEAEDVSSGEGKAGQRAEAEIESDADFVGALLVGARLLLRNLGDAEEAWRYVCLAGDAVQGAVKRRNWLSDKVRAEVQECKGIVRMAMGMRAGDPVTRPKYQAQSLDHLTRATTLDPTSSSALYHFAYCQAEARSIDAATESIRKALELESGNIQSWHLLSLLLTAQGDWEAAAKAGEAGVSVWEQEEEREMREDEGFGEGGNPNDSDPAVESKDFAGSSTSPPPTFSISAPQTSSEALLLPSGEFKPTRIMIRPTHPPAVSRVVRLEHVIRLRMTLNVIAEKIHGPEHAMFKQQELFSFFSVRSGKNRGQAGPISKVLPSSMSAMSFGPGPNASSSVEKGMEESFVNLNLDNDPAEAGRMENEVVAVQPPTPNVSAHPPVLPDSVSSPLSTTSTVPRERHSLDSSPRTSDTDSPRSSQSTSLQVSPRPSRRSFSGGRSLSGTKKLMAKHLHVPHQRSRPSSVRRASTKDDLHLTMTRNRAASSSSTALSLAPTAVHSHFRGSSGLARTPPPPPITQPNDHGRTPAESRILSNLWLMSAATFRRWGKLEQCLVAIEEAETLDPENNLVWVQLGLYHCALTPPAHEAALPAFTKAILLKPDNPPGIVCLAKLYLATGSTDLAHSLLNQVTQDFGWDVPEAWYYLGKCCQVQGREERARECWTYALSLEESKPARRWSDSVDRWL